MKEEEKEKIKRDLDKKLLSGREYEYVVSFRHRFLTYLALPLFLLFIAAWLMISYTVRVPERIEKEVEVFYSLNDQQWQLSLANETANSLASQVALADDLLIALPGEEEMAITAKIQGSTIIPDIKLSSDSWQTDQVYNATLVMFKSDERFLFKLLDELAKNIQIKRPDSEETGP